MSRRQHNLVIHNTGPKGTILIVVMWIVLILATLVIVLAQYTRTEAMAQSNYQSLAQAEAVAFGAVQYVMALLSTEDPAVLFDETYEVEMFEGIAVGDGYFWILRPNLSDDSIYEFGLTDEAGKVNLNQASLETLLKLPSMTSELANSIIDWKDENEEVSEGGAENETYLLLSDPYQCKNAPLETVEEVLLVKGGSTELLYGEDLNRNGILDWNENDGDYALPDDNNNGKLDPGFFNYVTIHSYEANAPTADDGTELINVTSNDNRTQFLELLTEVFGERRALEIIAPIRLREVDSIIRFFYNTGMEYKDFIRIDDRLTTTGEDRVDGRININNAPEEVLLCLPQLEQQDVDELIRKRSSLKDEEMDSIVWVTEVLEQEKAIAIGPYITIHSYQYSADIVAVDADGRAFCRYYVIIDMADGAPKIVYKQSLNQFGWPLDPEILNILREGEGYDL